MRRSALAFFVWMAALLFCSTAFADDHEQRKRADQLGVQVGMLSSGPLNMITDVPGVKVGHATRIEGDHIRTGVTAILPHGDNIFRQKVPGAIYNFNSFGKLAGSLQVDELGNIETPIVLTNTLSVGTAVEATAAWVLTQEGNEDVRSVNALVGETNDGYLNDIRGQHITAEDVFRAIETADSGEVAEGSVGAGTGTRSFGYKSGIGTASRVTTPIGGQEYSVGVLVQSNFGRDLYINGVPFTREIARLEQIQQLEQMQRQERQEQDRIKGSRLEKYRPGQLRVAENEPGKASVGQRNYLKEDDGSAMIIIATDAPLSDRNLRRMAKRSFTGMGRTVGYMSNFSGDFAIAFSTAYTIPSGGMHLVDPAPALIGNNEMNPLFQAVEEAVQEAIYNALFMSESMTGRDGNHMDAIPLDKVIEIMDRYNMRHLNDRFSDGQ
ncbi:MAG: P1 family peptidase [Cyclonatronaceae bacterium]